MKKILIFMIVVASFLSLGACQPKKSSGEGGASGDPVKLTILTEFTSAWVRNFNPFIASPLHSINGFGYEYLVIFNELNGMEPSGG